MANTVKYDRQDVIQKATDLFWEKGFHATSMRNLQEAIDMRPGSIYASFGSKEGLFKETLQYYADDSLALLKSYAEDNDSPLEALREFLTSVVINQKQAPSNMCMLVKTISELTDDNAELLADAKQLLSGVEVEFAELFTQAQAKGELDSAKDPKRLASLLQMQLMGLRAYARANEGSDQEIKALTDDAFASLVR
ncbi:TetR/AcrR family transcriptional regulator [Leucothrix pacifica]|uniref:TetR family transcriptional regulator n=1 Tax=Leucothrix pacifica TaxID=1247513 RepID=A0A317CQN8_9GAMM|nr:TetR/AcrR family transcriptional regulator [Leucothrix pacifica]PWQ99843.1 TetR family transcriptional regulator [Leucothrix pacifica]